MDLAQEIQNALAGSRKMTIVFKKECVADVMYLCGMERAGVVCINNADAITLTAIMQSRSWGSDANRKITITLGAKFDSAFFLGRMKRALESAKAI